MSVMGIQFVQQFCIVQMVKIVLRLSGSVYLTKNLLHIENKSIGRLERMEAFLL